MSKDLKPALRKKTAKWKFTKLKDKISKGIVAADLIHLKIFLSKTESLVKSSRILSRFNYKL